MSCCGQKRAALATSTITRTQVQPYAQPMPVQTLSQTAAANNMSLRYLGTAAISLRGSSTGRVYYFDKTDAVVVVHMSDIDSLLRTQLFVDEDV
jgi:hypothetical protein